MAVYSWASSDSRCIHEEDSTRLGDQDKDSSPPTYLTRTLVILGLWYIILTEAGLVDRDMLDHYDIIHHTLRF